MDQSTRVLFCTADATSRRLGNVLPVVNDGEHVTEVHDRVNRL